MHVESNGVNSPTSLTFQLFDLQYYKELHWKLPRVAEKTVSSEKSQPTKKKEQKKESEMGYKDKFEEVGHIAKGGFGEA